MSMRPPTGCMNPKELKQWLQSQRNNDYPFPSHQLSKAPQLGGVGHFESSTKKNLRTMAESEKAAL